MRDHWGHDPGDHVQAAATREQIVVAAVLTRQATDVHELPPMVEAANHNPLTLGQTQVGVLLADTGPALRGRITTALSPCERMRRMLTTKRGRRLYEHRHWMIEPVFGDIKENRGVRRFQQRGYQACASEWKLITTTHNLRKLYRRRLEHPSPGRSGLSGCPPPEPLLNPRRSGPLSPNPGRSITGGCRTTNPNRLRHYRYRPPAKKRGSARQPQLDGYTHAHLDGPPDTMPFLRLVWQWSMPWNMELPNETHVRTGYELQEHR